MKLSDFYTGDTLGLSFELYPPKTEAGMDDLFQNLTELVRFGPSYITCTYGAGGSTRGRTLDIVTRVRREFGLPVAAHLTCIGSTADQLRAYLRDARTRGIEFIVALRGDPPRGEHTFRPLDGGLSYANELVALIRREFPAFGIAVAGYPETHQEAETADKDLENLKRKVDAGADVVITQLFFSNEYYYRFRDRCEALGITVPIVPGILPITNLKQVQRFTSLCGARIPPELLIRIEAQADDPQGQFDVGVHHATRQAEDLVEKGAPGIHFYVLNQSKATGQLLRALNLSRKNAPNA